MNILGITSGSDSGVALFKDSELLLAVNEERLSRVKLDASYPFKSIDWCLTEAGLHHGDIDLICYAFTKGVEQGTFFGEMMERLTHYNEKESLSIVTERLRHEAIIDSKQKNLFLNNAKG